MSLKIRLTKVGSVHQALYRIVVAEARSRRDGAPVETLGTYSPNSKGKQIAVTLDLARVDHWVGKGAVPTDTVKSLVKKARRAAGASVVATT